MGLANGRHLPQTLSIINREDWDMKKKLFLIVSVLATCGCASTFQTQKFDAINWKPIGNGVEGVIYYEPQQVVVTYKFTILLDKDKNVIGSSEDSSCIEVIQKQELVIEPNFKDPRVLINKPSNFSNSKFSVTLSNGMLVSVNSESTPKATELIKEVTVLAKEASFLPLQTGGNPACNAGPLIREKNPWGG